VTRQGDSPPFFVLTPRKICINYTFMRVLHKLSFVEFLEEQARRERERESFLEEILSPVTRWKVNLSRPIERSVFCSRYFHGRGFISLGVHDIYSSSGSMFIRLGARAIRALVQTFPKLRSFVRHATKIPRNFPAGVDLRDCRRADRLKSRKLASGMPITRFLTSRVREERERERERERKGGKGRRDAEHHV